MKFPAAAGIGRGHALGCLRDEGRLIGRVRRIIRRLLLGLFLVGRFLLGRLVSGRFFVGSLVGLGRGVVRRLVVVTARGDQKPQRESKRPIAASTFET